MSRILPSLRALAPCLAAGALLFGAPHASALEAGDPVPRFVARNLLGKTPLSLGDYRGRVVYVDFWASWCGPCAASLPAIDALRREFPAEDFQVLAINVDKDPESAVRFLTRSPVGYPSASDPAGTLPELFGLETMPTSYLIDRQGIVRYVHRGFRSGDEKELREKIRELLGAGR